jgi:hypothetical protein
MTDCAFWGFNDETKPYVGPLFKNIKFSESLNQAIKKIGPATQVREGSMRPFSWKISNSVELTIEWPEPNKARVITYWFIASKM